MPPRRKIALTLGRRPRSTPAPPPTRFANPADERARLERELARCGIDLETSEDSTSEDSSRGWGRTA